MISNYQLESLVIGFPAVFSIGEAMLRQRRASVIF